MAAWEGVLWEGFSQDSAGSLPRTGWRQDPLAACQALFDAEGDRLPATVRDGLTWLLHASGYKTAGTKTLAAIVERLETSLRSEPTAIASQQEASPLAAVYPSFALSRLRHRPQGDTRLYLQALPDSILSQVETALHAERHEWQAALYSLGPSAPSHLRRKLVGFVPLEQASANSNGSNWELPLPDGTRTICRNRNHMCAFRGGLAPARVGGRRDLYALAEELTRRILSRADGHDAVPHAALAWNEEMHALYHDHHNAALVYSRIAADAGDEKIWKQAIGHWAVVLGNAHYWEEWYRRRSYLYGSTANELTVTDIQPRLLEQVRTLWEESQEPQSAARLRALMRWEQKTVAALQHVLQVAARQGIPVPPVVAQIASPLLLKLYGLADAADVLLAALDRIKASPYQEELLSKALSDAAEVEALLEEKEYELAMQSLHTQPASTGRVGLLGLIYPRYVEQLLTDERAEEALAQADTFLDQLPEHAQAEPLLARAATAWAETVLDGDTCGEVGRRLFAVKKRLSHVPPEFKMVLSAACAEFGAIQAAC